MSTNQQPTDRGVAITYAPGVLLSVPIIADEDLLDRLHANSKHRNGLELRAIALHLGITEPSRHHQWVIGWEQLNGDRPARLVWYDPEKLAAIEEEIQFLTKHYGPDVALEVTQGPGWDDWEVVITSSGTEHDPWDHAVPQPHHDNGDDRLRHEGSTSAPAGLQEDPDTPVRMSESAAPEPDSTPVAGEVAPAEAGAHPDTPQAPAPADQSLEIPVDHSAAPALDRRVPGRQLGPLPDTEPRA